MAGLDPNEALLRVVPRSGEHCLRTADILDLIQAEEDSIALVFFGAVHWQTGQWLDMEAITRAGKEAGCVVGWDCAHAAGNVPMKLHEWGVDFASWCTYKVRGSYDHRLTRSTSSPDRERRRACSCTKGTSISPGGSLVNVVNLRWH